MSSGLYKAVCYRCSYEGRVSDNRCPVCQFAMILEPEGTPPGGRRLEEIYGRRSVTDGAPPLPGVHAEKRKAQIMAEARRERIETQRRARMEPPPDVPRRASESMSAVRIPRFRPGVVKMTLFCASAVAAGAVAAALQSGAL
jgi:hypothetical protein